MNIVVPISRADGNRIEAWAECITKFGGLEGHNIIIIPTFSQKGRAYELAGRLNGVAANVEVKPLDMDNDFGHPKAPNWHWFNTALIMETITGPWFWMELDCLPVRAGWADAIAGAYTTCGAPFMGCVVKTTWKDERGNIVESPHGPDDTMMCGCGVYPAGTAARFRRIDQFGMLESLSKGETSADEPWDLFLRSVMRKIGMASSQVIGDYWNTINYRLENGVLKCDPNPTHNGNAVPVFRCGEVNPNSVVIHGCKDGSLHKLIMAGLDTRTLAPIPKSTQAVKTDAEVSPEISALKAQIDAQNQSIAKLTELLTQTLSASKQFPVSNPAPAFSASQEGVSSEGKVTDDMFHAAPASDSGSGNLSDQAFAIMSQSTKKWRLDKMSDELKVPANRLKAALDQDDRIVIGKLGWLSLAQAKV